MEKNQIIIQQKLYHPLLDSRLIDSHHLTITNESICSNNLDQCLLFNLKKTEIKELFHHFDLSHVDSHIEPIYVDTYKAYAVHLQYISQCDELEQRSHVILKLSRESYSDNLKYEYYVGMYINQYILPYLPIFIETYELLRFTPNGYRRLFQMFSRRSNTLSQPLDTMLTVESHKVNFSVVPPIEPLIEPSTNHAILLQDIYESYSFTPLHITSPQYRDLQTKLVQPPAIHIQVNDDLETLMTVQF